MVSCGRIEGVRHKVKHTMPLAFEPVAHDNETKLPCFVLPGTEVLRGGQPRVDQQIGDCSFGAGSDMDADLVGR